MKLTTTIISKMTRPEKPQLFSDDAVTALYLKHAPTGRLTFQHRTRKAGKWDCRTLGTWPDMTLEAARRAAMELNGSTVSTAKTFGELLDEWFTRRIEPRYTETKNVETYIARGKACLGTRKLTSLSTREAVDALKEYADVSPVAANRCLSNWKLALDYAQQSGYLEINPLARTTARIVGGEEQSRKRVLTDDEIRWVFACDHRYGPLLRALLLSGCRISELQAARAEDIEGDLLHIPENKSDRPHWVALTPLLRAQFGDFDGYLFADRSPTSVQSWLKRRKAGWTPHDLRRTFRTRLGALKVPPVVAELAINHALPGILGTYDQFDYRSERIAATELWSAKVKAIIDNR